MKPRLPLGILCLGITLALTCLAQPAPKLDVAQLKAVPDGNYLVTLELGGKQERINLRVQGNRAKCVNSTDPTLKDIEGQFQLADPQQGGLFFARFRGGIGSQLWIFRSDGAAAVREAPDRGEQQSAVPVKGDSLEKPKAK